jgi:hypothetical protein
MDQVHRTGGVLSNIAGGSAKLFDDDEGHRLAHCSAAAAAYA